MSDSKQQSSNSGEGISDDQCGICLGDIDNLSTTDVCSHKFCFKCIEHWSKKNIECPVCKKEYASVFHDFKEDGTHSTFESEKLAEDYYLGTMLSFMNGVFNACGLKDSGVQNMTREQQMSVTSAFMDKQLSVLSALLNPQGLTSQERAHRKRELFTFHEQIGTDFHRDVGNEQPDQSVPQTVSQGESSTRSIRAAPNEESDPVTEDNDHNPDLEKSEPSPNTEESEESTPNEPSCRSKRSMSDEDDQFDPQLKRHRN